MALSPELSYEQTTGRLGTIEHIAACAQLASEAQIGTSEDLKEFLQREYLPESIAHFIFDNKTPETQVFKMRPRTAVIDTRALSYYHGNSILKAEYNYEPLRDNNYVSVFGSPRYQTDSDTRLTYRLSFRLQNSLDLNAQNAIEAYTHRGPTNTPIGLAIYRSHAFAEYKQEHNPQVFIDALGHMAEDFSQYLRDLYKY